MEVGGPLGIFAWCLALAPPRKRTNVAERYRSDWLTCTGLGVDHFLVSIIKRENQQNGPSEAESVTWLGPKIGRT